MFLSPPAPLCYPEDTYEDPRDTLCKAPPSAEIKIKATNGATSNLRMWNPETPASNDTVRDLLFIPGAAVSHFIFVSPYIKQNAIEYFTQKGYRSWCLTTRFGLHQLHEQGSRYTNSWTSYDARLDIAAALEEIKHHNIEHSIEHLPTYIISHCVGSLALASALLDGTVHKTTISGITASQIFLHSVLQPLNALKARLPLPYCCRMIAGDWFPLSFWQKRLPWPLQQHIKPCTALSRYSTPLLPSHVYARDLQLNHLPSLHPSVRKALDPRQLEQSDARQSPLRLQRHLCAYARLSRP